MASQIVRLGGRESGQRFVLSDEPLTFGRGSKNRIRITNELASRYHAQIRWEEGEYVLYDQRSRNGTFVNGRQVWRQRLRAGDTISIGEELFGFEAVAADERTIPALPKGMVTFMFIRLDEHAELWSPHTAAAQAVLQQYDGLVETVISHHRGVVVRPRGEGGGYFAVFAAASHAFRAAVALQQALQAQPWPLAAPLSAGIALHTGEADIWQNDYYGSAVNRGARLRALAQRGQVLVSAETAELIWNALPTGARLIDIGARMLRGFANLQRVFCVAMQPTSVSQAPQAADRYQTVFLGE